MNRANGTTLSEVPVATLPGTPARGSFPISEQDLLKKAQYVFNETGVGSRDPSVLADDFRFEFPIVSLDRKRYLDALKSFGIEQAFPNLENHAYHFRVDPYEPNRVWFTTRSTGTHTGTLRFISVKFKATNREYRAAPEQASLIFNAEGKVITYTGGYVIDRRVGNTKGWGALYGILTAIGQPLPGSISLTIRAAIASSLNIAYKIGNIFTLGALSKVIKAD